MSPELVGALKAAPSSATWMKVISATADQASKAEVTAPSQPAGSTSANAVQVPPPSVAQEVPVGIRLQVTVAPVPMTGAPHLPGEVGPSTKAEAVAGTSSANSNALKEDSFFMAIPVGRKHRAFDMRQRDTARQQRLCHFRDKFPKVLSNMRNERSMGRASRPQAWPTVKAADTAARALRPRRSTSCISCRCRRGRDHCVRLWLRRERAPGHLTIGLAVRLPERVERSDH